MLRSSFFRRLNAGDGLMWQPELNPHAVTGEFSMAAVQANSSLVDQGQVFTSPTASTYAGVYDGHGGPEASRFISNQLFHNLHSNFVDRRSNRSSYSSSHVSNDISIGDDSRLVDWGITETPRDSLALTETVDRQTSIKRPAPGLTEEALSCLTIEIFHILQENINTSSRDLKECSICLESFSEGEVLTCLPCGHRYHFCCLDPWVRTCGDCPYCRTSIDVNNYGVKENLET